MTDYYDEDLQECGPGYYRIYYGLPEGLSGPHDSIGQLARITRLYDYPDDGYVVHFDGEVIGSIPSLNPDDLLQRS